MWSPTHVEVTVSRARNLKAKGKSGTNDAYVSIKLGKEKFQTTLRERAKDPEWHEQCQFLLSEENTTVKLKVMHRSLIGKDDFLGYAEIQLDPSLVYEGPKSRWYNLGNKPGDKGPARSRGEIEVFVTYVVQSIAGSHMNLNMIEKGRKLSAFKGLAHQFGDKLSLKGSLKRIPSQKSGSKSELKNLESGLELSSQTLPSHYRRAVTSTESREDERAAGLLEEVDEAEVDHQILKDKKPPTMKSSVFKLPFRSKNKQLQKMGFLSQSTLGLPSMKSTTGEFGHMHDFTNPPSESSSGFESRRVSTSESQASSSYESGSQVKESDDVVTTADATLTVQDIKQGLSSEGILSWKTGESDELKPELRDKGEHAVCAEESPVVEEIEGFDLREQEHLQDVQKGFYSAVKSKEIPESPDEISLEIGTTSTAVEMIPPTSDRNDMEEKIRRQEHLTAVANSDVLTDAAVTSELLSPIDESVSPSPNSSASRSESINFGSESIDHKQSSADLKLKATDLRQESLAHESEQLFDLLPDSSHLISEDNGLKSESFGLKSESREAIPESFALDYNSPFSKPESAILTSETVDLISDSSHSKAESIKILPELVDSDLKSESIGLFSKPTNLDHGSAIANMGPENLTAESSTNNLESSFPKQESLKGTEHTSQDSAMDPGMGLLSPVTDNRGCADGVDVTVDRTNSNLSQPVVDHGEPVFSGSRTKHTPESGVELTGATVGWSKSQTVETVEETEHTEILTPSSPTLLLPQAVLKQYHHHSRDDLIQIVLDQQRQLREKEAHIHDLENYIDNLLAKVLDVQPKILGANEKDAKGGDTSGPPSTSQSAGKSSLPSRPGNVQTPKATETYVAYQKVTKETAGPAQITMVTSPKHSAKKPGFLNVLKVKK